MDNSPRLSKENWLKAARLALLHHGPDGVRVEPLAKELGVTKDPSTGTARIATTSSKRSSRNGKRKPTSSSKNLGELEPHRALENIFDEVKRRTLASEKGEWPSDVAIFTWAQLDPAVAKGVNKSEEERMGLLRNFTNRSEIADSSTTHTRASSTGAGEFQKRSKTSTRSPNSRWSLCLKRKQRSQRADDARGELKRACTRSTPAPSLPKYDDICVRLGIEITDLVYLLRNRQLTDKKCALRSAPGCVA